ncbi:MAG: IMP dehydrogenase [Solobacterium sp.]|jgi:IMP dehydrogenase|nr:IMP dehydrogenase [Solobacterium sp.]MCH4050048.1 IMP dehydrogenase [Solobacterium sp.]MCH4073733.1 IMP dehydrogenase [Solobacterium sp.]MCI1313842.1 IMP dehydrogenase [Solobacterium sp.]MCI1407649.1 IMP dehydrogenase [Solobacterium sp.]
MAKYYDGVSHTFSEYLLVPGLTAKKDIPSDVSLKTPLVKFRKGEEPAISLNIPMVSAVMQSVSGDELGVALAKEGGMSFIFQSQSIASEAAMVARVKNYKAGFVVSDSNITPKTTLDEILEMVKETGHSTMPVTEDGTPNGKLVGLVTSRDYRVSRMSGKETADTFMTPREKLVTAPATATLSECNDIIWDHKLNTLPIVDSQDHLCYLVFRKDYSSHKENPLELLDDEKRFMVGAGINTRDYKERVPALVAAGADCFVLDSSDGFSEWQADALDWIKGKYGDSIKVGAGNVVDEDGFNYLASHGADFIKIGIGGGSICITRETKGIGRGQATSVIEVAKARDAWFERTGEYIPICSDGGIVYDYHIVLALAMGADFVMLGRYFSRFEEAPGQKLTINGAFVKEYWGEGSNRAKNWQRYDLGGKGKLSFEEGVDSYVPYAGPLHDNVQLTTAKIRSTMCNCGALSIKELQEKARLTLVSSTSIVEGGAHDVIVKNKDENYNK